MKCSAGDLKKRKSALNLAFLNKNKELVIWHDGVQVSKILLGLGLYNQRVEWVVVRDHHLVFERGIEIGVIYGLGLKVIGVYGWLLKAEFGVCTEGVEFPAVGVPVRKVVEFVGQGQLADTKGWKQY